MQAPDSAFVENIPPVAEHYPLGSWERHLVDEKLRALKECERQRRQLAALRRECTFRPRVGPSPHNFITSDNDKDYHKPIAPTDDDDDNDDDAIDNDNNNEDDDEEDTDEQQQRRRQRPQPYPRSAEGDCALRSSREPVPVFERLAQYARERDERLARLAAEKHRREEAALRDAFRPHLNTAPADCHGPVPRAASSPAVPVEERLLHYGRAVAQSRRLRQAQEAQKELRAFGPQRHRSSERDGENLADRSQRLLQARAVERALAAEAQLRAHSFRPMLCAASRAIDAQQKQQKQKQKEQQQQQQQYSARGDRGAALYEEGVRRAQMRQREAEAAAQRSAADGHRPATNPLTDEWILHGQHRELFAQGFVRRQEIYQRVRDEHRRGLAAALDARAGPPPAGRVDQSMIDAQVRRLYHSAQEARREAQARRGDAARERECPFRPALAPATPYVVARTGREPDVVKRLAAPRLLQKGGEEEEEAEEWDSESGEAAARRVVGRGEAAAFYERQRAAAAGREAARREQRQRAAMEELGACTFRPRTNVKRSVAPGAAGDAPRVAGASAHVQRQAMAQQRRCEADAQYEQLGRGLPCNGPSCTIVTPFRLSSGGARTRSAVLHVDPGDEATLRTRSRSAALS